MHRVSLWAFLRRRLLRWMTGASRPLFGPSSSVAYLKLAAIPSVNHPGDVSLGFREAAEEEWTWLDIHSEDAAWFADRLIEVASSASQRYEKAPTSRLVRLPDVRGLEARAAAHLERSGFRVRTVNADVEAQVDAHVDATEGPAGAHQVTDQRPPPNAPVPPDRVVVTLFVV